MSALTVLAQPTTYALTAGRVWSLVAVLLGVVGVAVGGLALARAARTWRAVVALTTGMAGVVVGGLVVVAADGGPGTGYGIVGGFMALVVGLIAMVLGGLALARVRRARARDQSVGVLARSSRV